MLERNDPHLDVEELEAKVESKARTRGPAANLDEPAPRLRQDILADLAPERLPEQDGEDEPVRASRLLALDDREFLDEAYRLLLHRRPDPVGYPFYLTRLRQGTPKVFLLARMRFSREGRRRAVPVRGLIPHLLWELARSFPVIGLFVRLVLAMVWPRSLDRQRRAVEGQLNAALHTLEERLVQDSAQSREEWLGMLRPVERELEELRRGMLAPAAGAAGVQTPSGQTGAAAPQVAAAATIAQDRIDELYMRFEERFRGSRDEILGNLAVYLPVVRSCGAGSPNAPILDIGCGRGEWLDLLRQHGLTARGLDSNRPAVEAARQRGLDAEPGDALGFLRAQGDRTFGAVTAFHVVEHLPFAALLELLAEVARVLRPGGVVVLETPDPANLLVGSCDFYVDLTHIRPIPSQTLAFLVEAFGMTGLEVRRLHPAREDAQPLEEPAHPLLHRLKAWMHGPRDYAVIAYRP